MAQTDISIGSSFSTHTERDMPEKILSLKSLYDNHDFTSIVTAAPFLIESYQIDNNHELLGHATYYYALAQYQLSHFDAAKELMMKVLSIIEQYSISIDRAKVYNHLGILERNLSHFIEAQSWYDKALDYYQQQHNSIGQAKVHNNLGMLHIGMGAFAEALLHFTESYTLRKRDGSTKDTSAVLNNIGLIYLNIGRYTEAMEFFTQALDSEKEYQNKNGIAICYLNIGSVHEHLKNYETALLYYRESMMLRSETGNINGTAHCLSHIGNLYFSQQKYEDALLYFSEALLIKQKVHDKTGEANYTRMIGECHFKQSQFDQAMELFDKAEQIHQTTGNKGETHNVLLCKAQLYTLPSSQYYNPQQAETILLAALTYASENADEKMEMSIRKHLSELYEQQKRAEESLTQYKMFHSLSEHIGGKDVLTKILTIETERKIEKIQKEHDDAIKKQNQLELLVKERTAQLDNLINKEHNFRHIHEAFVRHISHEFRTPLTAVTLGISVIEKMIDNAEDFSHASQIRAFCKAMNTATGSLRSILDSAQVLTQAQSSVLDIHLITTDITAIVIKYIPEWKAMMNPTQMVDIRIADYDIFVHSNQVLIEKMLHHILDNAMTYSPPNATITVSTSIIDGKGIISIHNTKSYISPKEQSQIFDVFYRGAQHRELSHGGLGIGLTVCTMYALALNASIQCKSDIENGTEFILTYPLSE